MISEPGQSEENRLIATLRETSITGDKQGPQHIVGLYSVLGCQQDRATRSVLFREVAFRDLAANPLEVLEHSQLCAKGSS